MRKLVIKSANGSVEDFKVDAELSWTVKELKAHIYRHYPTHPPLTCQKLIHRGKLLLDQSPLSEAINSPLQATDSTPEEAVVIHLVAYERSSSFAPSTTSSSTSERVHPSASSTSLPTGTSNGSGVRNRQSSVPQAQETGRVNPPQQQQHPGQRLPSQRAPPLINPWLRHTGGVAPNPMPAMQNLPVFGPGGVANGGYAFPQAPQFYQSPYGAAYANHLQQWYYNYYRAPGTGVGAGMGGGMGGAGDQNPQDLPNPVEPNDLHDNDLPEPEDQDDVPMNAPGGVGMMPGGQGLHRRRDLVDYLYMFSMISFLVLMAFLTGSLGRLLIFAAGLTFMLLNQAGFFSLQRRRQPAPPPNPLPIPNFNPEPARGAEEDNPEVVRPHQGEGAEQGDSPDGNDQNADGSDPPSPDHSPTEPDPQLQPAHEPAGPGAERERRPGMLSTILVFVTSFFTSLVPQQRPNLQVN